MELNTTKHDKEFILSDNDWSQIFQSQSSNAILDGGIRVFIKRDHKLHIRCQELQHEALVLAKLKTLQGICIPKFLGLAQNNGESFLVTAFVNGKPLSSKGKLFLLGVIEILSRIHDCGVTHCQLEPKRILITEDNQIFITGFKSSFIGSQAERSYEILEHLRYPNKFHRGEYLNTSQFSSVNAHLGGTPSPEWDYESAYYILLSLSNRLSWSSIEDTVLMGEKKIEFVVSHQQLKELVVCTHRSNEVKKSVEIIRKVFTDDWFQNRSPPNPKKRKQHPNSSDIIKKTKGTDLLLQNGMDQVIDVASQKVNLTISILKFLSNLGIEEGNPPADLSDSAYCSAFTDSSISLPDIMVPAPSAARMKALCAEKNPQASIWDIKLCNTEFTRLSEESDSDMNWTWISRVIIVAEDWSSINKMIAIKLGQLESDLIRFQCQHASTAVPHPLEIIDIPVWASIVASAPYSMGNFFAAVSNMLSMYAQSVPRLRILSLYGRLKAIQVDCGSSLSSPRTDISESIMSVMVKQKYHIFRSKRPLGVLFLSPSQTLDQVRAHIRERITKLPPKFVFEADLGDEKYLVKRSIEANIQLLEFTSSGSVVIKKVKERNALRNVADAP